MAINNSRRILNYRELQNRALKKAVRDRLTKLEANQTTLKKAKKKLFLIKLTKCSQCKRGMEKRIADLQIENKRENAPICVPCILGIKRKPLMKSIHETKQFRWRNEPKKKKKAPENED